MKLNKLIYVLSILFITISCDEEFLETYPTDSLSQEQVGEALAVNPAAAEGTLFGIYEQFYRLGSGGGQGQGATTGSKGAKLTPFYDPFAGLDGK